jgi:hypothetical protein
VHQVTDQAEVRQTAQFQPMILILHHGRQDQVTEQALQMREGEQPLEVLTTAAEVQAKETMYITHVHVPAAEAIILLMA